MFRTFKSAILSSRLLLLPSATIALAGTVQSAQAGYAEAYIFNNEAYTQTSAAGAASSPTGFFYSIEALTQNPNDFSSVTVTYPGPASPVSLAADSSTHFFYGGSGSSEADVASQLPFGTYTYTSNTGSTAALDYTANSFSTVIPSLSAATYDALQGTKTNSAIGVSFNSWSAATNDSYTFFTISDAVTDAVVYSAGFLSPSATSAANIAAGVLKPGEAYHFELDFSTRVDGTSNGISTFQGFDERTDGSFTTASVSAVPLPAALPMFGAALAGLVGFRKRKMRYTKA